jgi:hypothetical protein
LAESLSLSNGGLDGRFWCGRVLYHIRQLGATCDVNDATMELDVDGLQDVMNSFFNRVWNPVRYLSPDMVSEGVRMCMFHHWFVDEETGYDHLNDRGTKTFAGHLSNPHVSTHDFRILMRFRTGGWHLAVNTGRFNNISRHERLCEHCRGNGDDAVEDERHVLMQCPRYQHIRTRFAALFDDYTDMKLIINDGRAFRLVLELWRERFGNEVVA